MPKQRSQPQPAASIKTAPRGAAQVRSSSTGATNAKTRSAWPRTIAPSKRMSRRRKYGPASPTRGCPGDTFSTARQPRRQSARRNRLWGSQGSKLDNRKVRGRGSTASASSDPSTAPRSATPTLSPQMWRARAPLPARAWPLWACDYLRFPKRISQPPIADDHSAAPMSAG
jgi:hypothetical protein